MKPKFVAEFTTNHMGNKNLLLRMVEKAKWAGCDYIKMQKKYVESFYSKEKLAIPYESPYGKSYGDYRTTFEFDKEDFQIFDRKCKEHDIIWFATAQDIQSLVFLLEFDLPIYKVASSNARNKDMLKELAQLVPRNKTIIISVAGCSLKEIEESLSIFPNHSIYILHCVAEYPCQYESLRLGNIKVLRENFASERIEIGYSGHEEGIEPTFAVVDLGARLIERHFCISRHSFVHHIECSLEPEEYKMLIDAVRSGEELKSYYKVLPESAFNIDFGMSETERSFLIEQTYGRKYIKDESQFER